MGRLYLVTDRPEIERRRRALTAPEPIEIWPDLWVDDVFWLGDADARRATYRRAGERPTAPGPAWIGEHAKGVLDGEGGPLPFVLAIPEEAVPVYYGPHLTAIDSLPREESLRARVLSAHGIGVVWATYDPAGRRAECQPTSPLDPTFYLRRPRGPVVHVWRLFWTKPEALAYTAPWSAEDPEATAWAGRLPSEDFTDLVRRFGERA